MVVSNVRDMKIIVRTDFEIFGWGVLVIIRSRRRKNMAEDERQHFASVVSHANSKPITIISNYLNYQSIV